MEYGWLRREPTSPNEVKDLLGIVERSLADSKVEAVSTDLRFIAAFNAALRVSNKTLIRLMVHRTPTGVFGPHNRLVEATLSQEDPARADKSACSITLVISALRG